MRILTVSVSPLFPDRVAGGSQRILMSVIDALAEAGHEVRVLSTSAPGSDSRFETPGGAVVEPVLELRGAFPAPYQTAPHRLSSVWQRLAEATRWADRAYLHADAIYMRGALGDLPVVRSLHDYVYEEALLSAFTLPASRTIVPSQYVQDCLLASAGQVMDVGEVVVIPNGVAVPGDAPVPRLPEGVRPRSAADLVLLHPHRLNREKGIEQSLEIAVEVQKRMPGRKVRLLVPALQADGSADDAALGDSSVIHLAESTGASEMRELHHWLGTDEMSGYFAAGDATLCPGSFVEAFGLAPLESVVAGTPAICANAGALREQAGIEGITHFAPGDISAAASAVVDAVSKPFDRAAAKEKIARRYDCSAMRAAYVEAITGEVQPASALRPPEPVSSTGPWRLAPWCYVDQDRIYHDYMARFESFPAITKLLQDNSGLIESVPSGTGIRLEFDRARKNGFIVAA